MEKKKKPSKKIEVDKDITLVTEKSDVKELTKEEQKARDAHYKSLVKEWGGIYMTETEVLDKLWKYAEEDKIPPAKFRHDRFIAQEIMPSTYGITRKFIGDIQKKADPDNNMTVQYDDLPKDRPYAIMFSKRITQIIREHVKTEVAVESGKMTTAQWFKKIKTPHNLK